MWWAAALAAATAAVGWAAVVVWRRGRNPFASDSRRARTALELDHSKRNAVLKQRYTADSLPAQPLDAIVIGSGMGGLATAVLLAKAGKRVLVLEQHDQAGGCMHTFIDRGFEFDTGIHYVGEMRNNGLARFLIDQLTEGQVVFNQLDPVYDEVVIGEGQARRRFQIHSGRAEFVAGLKKAFPDEHKAIDKFMALLKKSRVSFYGFISFKLLPVWLTKLLAKTGLVNLYTDYFKQSQRTAAEVIAGLTQNEDLRAVLNYSFGDYGTLPTEAPFTMQAALANHFLHGGYYPEGGASEFAFRMIPVIERAGGKVLVNARVTEIVMDASGRQAVGVRLGKRGDVVTAPIIISDAGLVNTLSLLGEPQRHSLESWGFQKLRSGKGGITVFIALRGSNADNGLPARNYWIFRSPHLDQDFKKFCSLPREEALCNEDIPVPLMFLSFPSTKDPTWEQRFPGKSTAEIITLLPYEWFEEWRDERVMKRGADYDAFKEALGRKMWQTVLQIYPQLQDKVEYIEVGTPLTNQWYLNAARGELYGIDHTTERFNPTNTALLRPQTPVNGLYLTGQDVLTCGWAGAMFSGVLTASAVLNRNVFVDLLMAKSRFSPAPEKKQGNGTAAKAKNQ